MPLESSILLQHRVGRGKPEYYLYNPDIRVLCCAALGMHGGRPWQRHVISYTLFCAASSTEYRHFVG